MSTSKKATWIAIIVLVVVYTHWLAYMLGRESVWQIVLGER